MEDFSKKSKKADLENKRLMFWQIGAIVSLALVFFAFEYRSEAPYTMKVIDKAFDSTPVDEVPITVQPQKLLPPPVQPVVRIEVVDNLTKDVKAVNINAEPQPDVAIDNIPPPLPPEVLPDEPIIKVPEIAPEFPGGIEALMVYLSRNIKYPAMARQQLIQGRVYLSFVVEKDGSVTNITLLRGIGGGCDEEAMRVVSGMPSWKPGRQNGMPVRVAYNLPVRFSLQ